MSSDNTATFPPNAVELAKQAMCTIGHPELSDKFAIVINFLQLNPSSAPKLPGKNAPAVGSVEYIQTVAHQFVNARIPQRPSTPSTIPDEMVSFILQHYFDRPEADLARLKKEHLLSMGAENFVGELLERYLAKELEPTGWVWVSGSLTKAADFLRPPTAENPKWHVLQVKNRDNSENSSSSAIRDGTEIQKWFRTFSKKAGSNWNNFPDALCRAKVSEDGFKEFVRTYLAALKVS